MYGIINKSIGEMVTQKFGLDVWVQVLKSCGIEERIFLTNEAYDDVITFQLATSIANLLQTNVDLVLLDFGKWWIMHTCNRSYGVMMQTGGRDLKQFLLNLPSFHHRVQLMYPKLAPPEFQVDLMTDTHFRVHYYSSRTGLNAFVEGLLLGLGEYFNQKVSVQLIDSFETGNKKAVLDISWS